MSKQSKFETSAVHAGQEPDKEYGAVIPPLYTTSTYAQPTPGEFKAYDYSRGGNPTRAAFETAIATLESGAQAFATASGCAAMTTILALLKKGDHVISGDDLYGGTYRLFSKILSQFGIEFDFINLQDLETVKSAIKPNTKLMWLETPTNPMMKLTDICELKGLVDGKDILLCVDNTFMSPYFQRPLELGADIVMHSATKYLGGHSDLIAGAIIAKTNELAERLQFLQMSMGGIASPWDCYLLSRSLKTLALRMSRHQENAMAVAEYLEKHPKIERVFYPGLESFPQKALADKQMHGYGGMISMHLKGGLEESRKLLENVKIFLLAESLGGVESLIEHPAIMTHASVPAENRAQLGIVDNFIRLSVGVEHKDDLIQDLDAALSKL